MIRTTLCPLLYYSTRLVHPHGVSPLSYSYVATRARRVCCFQVPEGFTVSGHAEAKRAADADVPGGEKGVANGTMGGQPGKYTSSHASVVVFLGASGRFTPCEVRVDQAQLNCSLLSKEACSGGTEGKRLLESLCSAAVDTARLLCA